VCACCQCSHPRQPLKINPGGRGWTQQRLPIFCTVAGVLAACRARGACNWWHCCRELVVCWLWPLLQPVAGLLNQRLLHTIRVHMCRSIINAAAPCPSGRWCLGGGSNPFSVHVTCTCMLPCNSCWLAGWSHAQSPSQLARVCPVKGLLPSNSTCEIRYAISRCVASYVNGNTSRQPSEVERSRKAGHRFCVLYDRSPIKALLRKVVL
jgi:hypothetical protein